MKLWLQRRWRLIACLVIFLVVLASWVYGSTPVQIAATLVGVVLVLAIFGRGGGTPDDKLPFWRGGSGTGSRSGGGIGGGGGSF